MVSYSAFWGGVAVPLLLLAFFVLAPWLDGSRSAPGLWFARDRLWLNLIFAAILLSQLVFIVIGQYLRGENWKFVIPF